MPSSSPKEMLPVDAVEGAKAEAKVTLSIASQFLLWGMTGQAYPTYTSLSKAAMPGPGCYSV